jgi:hypothetical protein
MALERPLWRFAHPHFCVCVKPLRGFFQRKRKNVANLLSLNAIVLEDFRDLYCIINIIVAYWRR